MRETLRGQAERTPAGRGCPSRSGAPLVRRAALATLALASALAACRGAAPAPQGPVPSTDAYRRALDAAPRSTDSAEAQERLAELELAAARQAHTIGAYKRFLAEFGSSPQAAQAEALLETLRFEAARERNDADTWHRFLREHPAGAHHGEARRRLDEAEHERIVQSDDVAVLRRFVAANPDDPRAAGVAARLDRLAWERAASAEAVLAYLRDFPAGAFRDEARVKLLGWQLAGLLVSGELDAAAALARRSPLAGRVPDLAEALEVAERKRELVKSAEPRVAAALVTWHVRGFAELSQAIRSGDPMDRWEAAEELGQVATVRALDTLVGVLREASSQLVRLRAFDSLRRIVDALPPPVADFELTTRLEALAAQGAEPGLLALRGILLDLSGQPARAATEYQRAIDGGAVDPVVLWRWASLRAARGQHGAAAVTARNLALWSDAALERFGAVDAFGALAAAREACGALEALRRAEEVLAGARAAATQHPDDVTAYRARAAEIRRRLDARLNDAELLALEVAPRTRRCSDASLRARLTGAEEQRVRALEALVRSKHAALPLVLALVRDRDTSPRVRALAAGPGAGAAHPPGALAAPAPSPGPATPRPAPAPPARAAQP